MTTTCRCPHCNSEYTYTENYEGMKIRCSSCELAFVGPPAGAVNVIAQPFQAASVSLQENQAAPVAARANPPHCPPAKISAKPSSKRKSMLFPAVAVMAIAIAGAWHYFHDGGLSGTKAVAAGAPFNLPSVAELTAVTPAPNKYAALPPSERVNHFDDALARAKATGNDIVVFQRGSDWNRLSEHIYQNIWSKEPFFNCLGNGFVILAVDNQENPGASPVALTYPTDGNLLTDTRADRELPQTALTELAAKVMAGSACEITGVTSDANVPYAKQPDGSWKIDGTYAPPAADPSAPKVPAPKVVANPPQDVLTLKLKPTTAGQVLRLDFPLDMQVANHGPGRAGNIVISEVQVSQGGSPVKVTHAWSSNSIADKFAVSKVIDGITNKPDEGWNAQGGKKSSRSLFLALQQALLLTELEVKLVCKSQFAGHIPTCVMAGVIADDSLAASIAGISSAAALKARNASYTWNDTTFCPRIALLDSQGRAIACDNRPRINLTASALAARIHELRTVREQRDALWAKAAAATGVEKAAFLAEGIHHLRKHIGDTTGVGMWDGNSHCYKPVFDEIAKLDPMDASWVCRILRCGADSRCGFASLDPAMRKAGAVDYFADAADAIKEKNHDKALGCYDAMIAHPNFQNLSPDLKQRVLLAKFTVYRSWSSHETQAIAMLRKIIEVSNETNLGKGAIGLLAYTFTDPPDNFAYGWGAKSVKPGDKTFNFIRGLDVQFREPGSYILQINRTAGNDSVNIRSVVLRDGDKILAQAAPTNNVLGPATPVLNLPVKIHAADWKPTARNLNLVVNLSGTPAKTSPVVDCGASFTVVRVFDDSAATTATTPKTDYPAMLVTLNDSLTAHHDFTTAAVRLALARREFIDACGPLQLNVIQERPGGAAMLAELMNDVDWLETFLTSCPPAATYAASADNLRILASHCEGFKVPVYRRLATAIALSTGNTPGTQLIQAYDNYRNAHRNMLLYTDFEHLDVRSMRDAIDFCSKEDFEFLQNDRQLTPAAALGACWAVWYMTDSMLGGNIQGGGYLGCFFFTPWTWTLLSSQGARFNGGVCGSLSTFGALCARINGIQSHTVGQPSHCAYVARIGKAWPVGYYVGGPTGCGVPGWPGVGYNTANTLQEPVMQDRIAVLEAARHSWVAHVMKDASSTILTLPAEFKVAVYDNRAPKMPDFTKLTPLKSTVSRSISPNEIAPNPPFNTDFAATWEGDLQAATDCDLNARFSSFDEAQVFIDGKLIGTSTLRTPFAKIVPLKSGKHALKVAYRATGGRCNFDLSLRPVPAAGAWQASYQAAIKAQPANYGTWNEYLTNLKPVNNLTPEIWKTLADSAALTFKDDQEAAWALVNPCHDMLKPNMKPDDLKNLYLDAHRKLHYTNKYPHHFEGLNLAAIIKAQAAALGTPDMQMMFFEKLLGIHFNEDPASNRYFAQVLDWGNGAFGRNPKLSGDYTAAIGRFFKTFSATLDKNLMRNTIIAGIKNASETGDLAAYKLWNSLAKDFTTPDNPRWDPKTQGPINEQYGQPFSGSLLSPEGLLQCSSPVSYLAFNPVQNAGQGSFFYVNKMKNPWLTLQLGGESELSGIVVLGHNNTQMPWKFSVSADNKSWTEVAMIQAYEPGIRIDLQGKGIKAKYVKLERPADCPDNFIHLRNFLVYGKKLY